MGTWAEFARDLTLGVAAVMVACNYRDAAWRIHGFLGGTGHVKRLLTPTTVRVTCGVLAAVSVMDIADGLDQP
ncbi:hypothetical protein [Streptomyces sp. ISL-11]|uniref:hypothetical protein n=1 Tax=Streptomyces sp. ISL-11 TaxID=2819174 RepID=UPI001BEA97BD|nr:hypothetical protein [Streptomyces sp. ISL-11]MBT2383759.1 hypothetical protein [Streptomyces sp. ISL-11]